MGGFVDVLPGRLLLVTAGPGRQPAGLGIQGATLNVKRGGLDRWADPGSSQLRERCGSGPALPLRGCPWLRVDSSPRGCRAADESACQPGWFKVGVRSAVRTLTHTVTRSLLFCCSFCCNPRYSPFLPRCAVGVSVRGLGSNPPAPRPLSRLYPDF